MVDMREMLKRAHWAFDGLVDQIEAACRRVLSWIGNLILGILVLVAFGAFIWLGYVLIAETGHWLLSGRDTANYQRGYEDGVEAVCGDVYLRHRRIYERLRQDRIC